MPAFVHDAPSPHLATFIDPVGELIPAVLDVDRGIAPQPVAAIDIGDTGHGIP
jgi:hypothetical protein